MLQDGFKKKRAKTKTISVKEKKKHLHTFLPPIILQIFLKLKLHI